MQVVGHAFFLLLTNCVYSIHVHSSLSLFLKVLNLFKKNKKKGVGKNFTAVSPIQAMWQSLV